MPEIERIKTNFLSRLCGGELSTHIGLRNLAFLSRLCGGELCKAPDPLQPLISKPPVRRGTRAAAFKVD